MTVGVTAEVEYIEKRGMWRVIVYTNGVWQSEAYFHTEWGALQWAAEVEARG